MLWQTNPMRDEVELVQPMCDDDRDDAHDADSIEQILPVSVTMRDRHKRTAVAVTKEGAAKALKAVLHATTKAPVLGGIMALLEVCPIGR